MIKITIEELRDGWFDWIVEGDPNARGAYCGGARLLERAIDEMADAIRDKRRHPYTPTTRIEY